MSKSTKPPKATRNYDPNCSSFSKLQIAIGEWIAQQPDLSALNTGVPLGSGFQLTEPCVALHATKAALSVISLAAEVADLAKATE